jgi:hypothetical protein
MVGVFMIAPLRGESSQDLTSQRVPETAKKQRQTPL